jgi:hypothetical protein
MERAPALMRLHFCDCEEIAPECCNAQESEALILALSPAAA